MPEYKSLKDHVYEYLWERINDRSLKPAEKIDLNNICESLQISRTPVREALAQLENEGLLEKLPRRGYVVREINMETIKELYTILGCLEGLAAELACSSLTQDDFVTMNRLLEKMDESIEKRNYRHYDKFQIKFHDVYISKCGSRELQVLISSLKNRFIKKGYSREEDQNLYETLKISNEEHKYIAKLMEEKNVKELQRFLKEVHWTVHTPTLL